MFRGRCLCGKVAYEIDGGFEPFAYCHCVSCRRSSGSAFMANSRVDISQVRWTKTRESIREYESSPGKLRAFCGDCGSPVYARRPAEPEWLSMRLGLIDADPGQRPQAHFNVQEKAPWFPITDDLPRYSGDSETR
jgi:hypothetical protein